MGNSRHKTRRDREGLTLLEIVIVLALLVILAGVAMPAFAGVVRRQRLRSAAEAVRAEWMRAHIRAMKTGRIHVYRFQAGDRHFEVIPWVAADDALESSTTADTDTTLSGMATASGTTAGGVELGEGPGLPEGVIFVGGDAQSDSRALTIEDALGGSGGGDGQWGAPILFYPDGTASDAFVIVANDSQEAVRIDLRGLTGLATVGGVSLLDQLLQ
jgi:prepilin-type N-terminal cleavage/methylation domain-containing protein